MGGEFDPDLTVAHQMQVGMVLFAFSKRADIVDEPNAVAKGRELPVTPNARAVVAEPPLWKSDQVSVGLGRRQRRHASFAGYAFLRGKLGR